MKNIKKYIRKIVLAVLLILLFCLFIAWKRDAQGELVYSSVKPSQNGKEICLKPGESIELSFTIEEKNMYGFSILLVNPDGAVLDISVSDDEGNAIGHYVTDEYMGDEYHRFVFDEELKNRERTRLTILINNNATSESGNIFIKCCDEDENIFTAYNGQETDFGVCFIKDYFYVDINKLSLILMVVGSLGIAVLVAWFTFAKVRNMAPENIFILPALCVGLGMMLVIPIGTSNDEVAHFLRAYEISTGHLISDVGDDGYGGAVLDNGLWLTGASSTIYKEIKHDRYLKLDGGNKFFYKFSNTAAYAPTNYFPHALGMALAHIFTDNVVIIGYAGRIMNLIVCLALIYLAVKIIPIGKWLIMVVSLGLMSMQGLSTLSADGFCFAVAMLLLAFVLYMRYNEKNMTVGHYISMYALVVFVSLSKIVYMPFCLLLFIIPKEKFGSNRRYISHVIAAGLLALLLGGGWTLMFGSSYKSIAEANIDTAGQIKYILSNITAFPRAVFNTAFEYNSYYIPDMVGGIGLGWHNIPVNYNFVPIQYFILFYVMLREDMSVNEKKLHLLKTLLIVPCAIIVFLILLSEYIMFTEVGEPYIFGIQGRYFIPLIVPLVSAIRAKAKSESEKSAAKSLEGCLLAMSIVEIFAVCEMLFTTIV